jgi:hypothetical protein
MATLKDFGAIETPSFRSDMGYETRHISGRFSAADTMCSGTHFNGAETHADVSRILGLETHHGSLHFRIDFGPLDSNLILSANFRCPGNCRTSSTRGAQGSANQIIKCHSA